jgi:hypothetical protein
MLLFQQSSVGMFHGSADGGEVAEVNQVLHRWTQRFVAQAHSVGKRGKIIFDRSSKLNYLSYFMGWGDQTSREISKHYTIQDRLL